MECRICLEGDEPETMLQPCQCRGTSAYVHQRCLERYFQFYPDGICRVCNTQIVYYAQNVGIHIMYILAFLVLICIIHSSTASIQHQLIMLFFAWGTLYAYWVNQYETKTMVYIISSILFLYMFGNPKFDITIIVVGLTVFYALQRFIPPHYLAHMMVIIMLGAYTLAVLYAAAMVLDTQGQGVTLATAVMLWNLYIGLRPEFHLE